MSEAGRRKSKPTTFELVIKSDANERFGATGRTADAG